MSQVTLHAGDNRESLRRLIGQGVRVHSVVCDPPYGLTSVTKRFGKEGAAPAKFGSDGAFSRASAGFMGKAWDGTGIERDPEFWRLIYDILLPGGFVFAFSGARSGHWQACAMEMAGFIMHPMHGWLYGSGMPKAHNPCPAIDSLMGIDVPKREPGNPPYDPKTAEAQKWDGWRHGTQTQKPALEPIYLAQKPYSEKTGAANLLKHGVGALNIDGCRIGTSGGTTRSGQAAYERTEDGREDRSENWARTGHEIVSLDKGRWPANLLHDGSEDVVALFPDSQGQIARSSSSSAPRAGQNTYGAMKHGAPGTEMEPRNDSGSAARFFNSFPLLEDDYQWALDAGLIDETPDGPVALYHAKATKVDRAGSRHPTVKPIGLMQHLIRHVTPPGGTVLDPFAGSGTTAEAARREGVDCILMEAEPEYIGFLRQRFNLPGKALPTDILAMLGDCDIPQPEPDLEDMLA